jgi:hypothetical protein
MKAALLGLWNWEPARDADIIVDEVQRYCPELPFVPEAQATFEARCSLYPDYRLVRLVSRSDERGSTAAEFYGLYARGDFRPLDPVGRTIAHLNKIGPLALAFATIEEYAVLRVTFELEAIEVLGELVARGVDRIVADDLLRVSGFEAVHAALAVYDAERKTAAAAWDEARWRTAVDDQLEGPPDKSAVALPRRRAAVVRTVDDLPPAVLGAKEQEALHALVAAPAIEMVPVQEDTRAPKGIQRGDEYRLGVSLLLQSTEREWTIVRATVAVSPDGRLVRLREPVRQAAGIRTAADSSTSVQVVSPRRTATAMIDLKWRTLAPAESAPWRSELRHFDVDRLNAVLRETSLPFYRTYRLLEVLEPHRHGYRRSYALIAHREGVFRIQPLNGTSPILHQINAEPDELLIDDETAGAYLRFFGWAVQAEGGPFYIPRAFREIPLEELPVAGQDAALRALDFSVRDVPEDEATRLKYPPSESRFRRKSLVAYDSAVFEAWFAIQTTGMVEMVHDEPRAADLVLRKERYGRDELFVLKEWVKTKGRRPVIRHYREESGAEARPPGQPSSVDGPLCRADDFVRQLAEHGAATGLEIDGPVTLDLTTLRVPR